MRRHTLGPWKAVSDSILAFTPDGFFKIATMSSEIPELERKANLQLMTLAPEMLEAIHSEISILRTWKEDFANGDEHKRTVINTMIHNLTALVSKSILQDSPDPRGAA